MTDVDGMSAGYRGTVTWGQPDEPRLTVGTDLIRVGTATERYRPDEVVRSHFRRSNVLTPSRTTPFPDLTLSISACSPNMRGLSTTA